MSIVIFADDGPDAYAKCIELGLNFNDVIWVREVEMLDDATPKMHIDEADVHYTASFRGREASFQRAKNRFGDHHLPKRDK